MERFKEIKATFKGIGKGACEGKEFIISIERMKSGASAYGDLSAHSIEFANDGMPQCFDTRYDGIPTDKQKWCLWWSKYLVKNYLISGVELLGYEENEIEMAE